MHGYTDCICDMWVCACVLVCLCCTLYMFVPEVLVICVTCMYIPPYIYL